MSVHISHLVLEALGHADDHVADDGADGAQRGDVLAGAMVDLDVDLVLGGRAEADGQVGEVLLQLAAGALDGDQAGLDVDLDCAARPISAWLSFIAYHGESSTAIVCVRRVSFRHSISTSLHLPLFLSLGVGEELFRHTPLRNLQLLLRVNEPHVGRLSAVLLRWLVRQCRRR